MPTPTNLNEYYTGQGQTLPSVSARQGVASQAGISGYAGTAAQNAQLLSYLQTKPASTNPVANMNSSIVNQSTTTLSSNKSADIAKANATLNTLSQKGVTTDPTSGLATHADGTVYTPPKTVTENNYNADGSTTVHYSDGTTEVKPAPAAATSTTTGSGTTVNTDTSGEDTKIQANLDQIKANTDAVTAAQITSIQNRYAGLIEEQKRVNESQTAMTTNALIMSGAMQHDVYSNDAIKARMDQGSKAINDLENQENDLINAAKAAQLAGDNKILEQKNAEIQKVRDNKLALTQKMNEDLIAETKKAREVATQAKTDQSVADIYSSGITDVPGIISALKAKGINVTSKDVSDTLKNIIPNGLDDLVKTLRQNGAPQDVISKVLASKDINEAYKNAGAYGAGGTGIIGEYNFYKAQAEAKGQVPLDFNAYQTLDANRKALANGTGGAPIDISTLTPAAQKKLTSTGFSAYNNTTQSLAQELVSGDLSPGELSKKATGNAPYNDVLAAANAYSVATTGKKFDISKASRDFKFANNPTTLNTLNYLGSLAGSVNDKGELTGGNLNELETLSNSINRTDFPAINKAEAWAKLASGDVKIAQFQAVATEVADQVAKILQGGNGSGGTSDAKLQQAANLFNTQFTKAQLSGVISSLKPLLANRASNMIKDNPYLKDYADQFGVDQGIPKIPSMGDKIIQSETAAQSQVDAAAKADPEISKIVYDALSKPDPDLGRVMTYSEIQQYLQSIGKIK